MQFDKNKNVFVHRWYPFVEGYSKEFIEDILNELPFAPTCALEPFCGSGYAGAPRIYPGQSGLCDPGDLQPAGQRGEILPPGENTGPEDRHGRQQGLYLRGQ